MGSKFGAIWEDPEVGFIKFVVKRASKQDQTLHMEGETSRYSLLQGGVCKGDHETDTVCGTELVCTK